MSVTGKMRRGAVSGATERVPPPRKAAAMHGAALGMTRRPIIAQYWPESGSCAKTSRTWAKAVGPMIAAREADT